MQSMTVVVIIGAVYAYADTNPSCKGSSITYQYQVDEDATRPTYKQDRPPHEKREVPVG